MRTIIEIQRVDTNVSRKGNQYFITHALLDDGGECEGFGKDFKVGDEVEVFLHRGKIKMQKSDWDVVQV